jgi:hypothetical protein
LKINNRIFWDGSAQKKAQPTVTNEQRIADSFQGSEREERRAPENVTRADKSTTGA